MPPAARLRAAAAAHAMAAPKNLSPEKIAAIRQDYANGVPVAQIMAGHEITRGTLYYHVDGGPVEGPRHLPPLPRRGSGPRRRTSAVKLGSRRQLVQRLWRTASRQVREIEDRLRARAGGEPEEDASERERDARMLAVLVKTLRELSALDQAASAAETPAQPQADSLDDDDPVPRDIDEFRRELTRRIHAFIADRRNGDERLPGAEQDDVAQQS